MNSTKPQLSKPQQSVLLQCLTDSMFRCVESYPPALALVKKGLATYNRTYNRLELTISGITAAQTPTREKK